MRGRFISIEGGEGSGKSTQTKALAARLEQGGVNVVLTREPGGTEGAEAIRKLLLEGDGERWTAESEALLFAAARADHVARLIEPALKDGAWVISDRFVDSSRAYQGFASGLGDAEIVRLHQFGSHGLLPDRSFFLHVDPDVASERVTRRDGGRDDRIGGRDEEFHAAVERGFAAIADQEPDRVAIIDAGQPVGAVTDAMMARLQPWL